MMKNDHNSRHSRTVKLLNERTLTWDGVERSYLEFVPQNYDGSHAVPLVVGLHGRNCNAINGFEGEALLFSCNLKGWIMISPQGLKDVVKTTGWNAGVRHTAFSFHFDLLKDVDDVGFICALIEELSTRFNIDRDRVFVLGFSMGGFMANRLAIERGDMFRAVCSVNGTIGNLIKDETPKCPVNVLHIHGTDDPSVPYDSASQSHPHGIGAEQVVEYWRKHNQCAEQPQVFQYPKLVEEPLSFERRLYTNGKDGARAGLIVAHGGVHTWYDHFQHDIDYSVEIMHFFDEAPLLAQEKRKNQG